MSPMDLDAMRLRIESLSPAKRALLEQQLRARAEGGATIRRQHGNGAPPVSFAQELLWELNRVEPDSYAYNVVRALRLTGPLNREALQQSLDALVARHESLRTTFASDGGVPVQIVAPPPAVVIDAIDLSSLAPEDRAATLERIITERARRPFDLAHDAQFRVSLIQLGEREHVMIWAMHHITMDGWSATIALREWEELYARVAAGSAPSLPAIPITYGDFAAWQRQSLTGATLDGLLGYWRERLSGAPDLLELPTDFPRPLTQRFEGGQHSIVLPAELVGRLRDVARRNDVTLYMLLVAAYVTLLHRLTGQDDVVIGSPVAARTHPETEHVVGYFANTLAYRNDLSGDPTFAALLGRVRQSILGALDHQQVPLEKLVLGLQGDRRHSRAPLFQCVLTMEDAAPAPARLGELIAEPVELDFSHAGAAKFDLLLLAREMGEGLRLMLQYRGDLFTEHSADRILARLRVLLDAVSENPDMPLSRLRWVPDAEYAQIAAWSSPAAPAPYTCAVHEMFSAQARRIPAASAIVGADATLTFAEAEARTNRLARHLLARGVEKGNCVGIALDRCPDAILAILAVLKAGAAYVPLPPELPAIRLGAQLRDGDVRVVITNAGVASSGVLPSTVDTVQLDADAPAIALESSDAPEVMIGADDPAYVLFTSGSTGVPKGVVVTHGNLAHYVAAISARLGVPDADTSAPGVSGAPGWHFGLGASWGADLGHTALFPALTSGGTLHVLAAGVTSEPAAFVRAGAAQPLDVLKLTPSHWGALTAGLTAAELATVLPRQWLVLGGEALRWTQAAPWARALANIGSRLLNHYGPTEATVGATTWEVVPPPERPESSESPERVERSERAAQAGTTVPIGRPLPGVRAYVVDAHGQRVPVGVAGELWLGGAGIARGYVGAPARTAERFGPDPFSTRPEARLYRTGDRVRWRADGTLEFLGRVEGGQVKLRGYRVELGEIESVLTAHDAVAQGVVVAISSGATADAGSELALVAYVELARDSVLDTSVLGAWLGSRLPDYMVPRTFIVRDALPLSANGKLDRKQLEADARLIATDAERAGAAAGTVSGTTGDRAAAGPVAPRTETERALIAIWSEVLKMNTIGVTDNFLALGGHSLSAIRVLGKISKQFGTRLPLRALFEAPTIEQLAGMLPDRAASGQPGPTPGGA